MADPAPTSGSRSTSGSSRSATSGSSDSSSSGHHGGALGVSVSSEGADVSVGDYGVTVGAGRAGGTISATLWDTAPPPIPTAIPGVFITLTPNVSVSARAVADFSAGEFTTTGSLSGSLHLGLEGGAPPLASVYLRGGPVLTGTSTMVIDRNGLKSSTGRIDLDMTARIGVQVQEVFDIGVDLGSARMLSLIGYDYQRDSTPHFRWGTMEVGEDLRRGLEFCRAAIQRARDLGSAVGDAVSSAYRGTRDYVASGLGSAYETLTSW